MRLSFKAFLISFLASILILGSGFGAYAIFLDNTKNSLINDANTAIGYETHESDADKTPLERLVDKSSRVNILLYGTDGGRTDTMMVMSYDPDRKIADLISIPRDTYNPVPGYDSPGMKKLNAFIQIKDGGGPDGLKKEISKILKIPISYYVEVEYDGVRKVVDSVDGVEIDVPFSMDYDDPYCTPPLHIHLKKGYQTLNGQKSIEFLRWRKNNRGSGATGGGDVPRTERQQAFVKAFLKKSISTKLPAVIQTASKYVGSDMSLDKMLFFAATASSFDTNDIKTYSLPGNPETRYGASYFIIDEPATDTLMQEIYSRSTQDAVSGGSTGSAAVGQN